MKKEHIIVILILATFLIASYYRSDKIQLSPVNSFDMGDLSLLGDRLPKECPTGTKTCTAGLIIKDKVCCPSGYSCGEYRGIPFCSADDSKSCQKGELYCAGASGKRNACCNPSKQKCAQDEKTGHAFCKDKDAPNCQEGTFKCGENSCCRSGVEECKTKLGHSYCSALKDKCPKGETFCQGRYGNICCPPSTQCVTTGSIPNCIPLIDLPKKEKELDFSSGSLDSDVT